MLTRARVGPEPTKFRHGMGIQTAQLDESGPAFRHGSKYKLTTFCLNNLQVSRLIPTSVRRCRVASEHNICGCSGRRSSHCGHLCQTRQPMVLLAFGHSLAAMSLCEPQDAWGDTTPSSKTLRRKAKGCITPTRETPRCSC